MTDDYEIVWNGGEGLSSYSGNSPLSPEMVEPWTHEDVGAIPNLVGIRSLTYPNRKQRLGMLFASPSLKPKPF